MIRAVISLAAIWNTTRRTETGVEVNRINARAKIIIHELSDARRIIVNSCGIIGSGYERLSTRSRKSILIWKSEAVCKNISGPNSRNQNRRQKFRYETFAKYLQWRSATAVCF